MAKTQRRRKMSRRRNKSRSLKGGMHKSTAASSKSHIAAASAPASSLAVIKRDGETNRDFLERLKKQVAYIASLKKPEVANPVKTLTPHEMALIKMQQKINARNAEVRSASRARPKHGDSSYAEYSRAAAAARGTGNPQ